MEKHPGSQIPILSSKENMPRRRESLLKTVLLAFLFALAYLAWSSLNPWRPRLPESEYLGLRGGGDDSETTLGDGDKKLVPLEAHIMSKCPDARDCLRQLVLPAMQAVYDKVDFKLSFIGSLNGHDETVECMHGPTECLGNMLELCSAQLYPDPKIYLGFTMCLSRQYQLIPNKNLVEDCALEHGVDFQKLNACVSDEGGEGMKLLRDSVQRSLDVGVKYSCTVRLNNKVRCIMDGGEWKDCEGGSSVEDLVRDVEDAYHKANDQE
ncbi:MAG: hypothetical protein M1814_000742 [Vezdaea aestivalis]|nr:MAG: hypothetical protein M1814_000742 [Vezdaea aestivalis]